VKVFNTSLNDIDPNIVYACIDLFLDKLRRRLVDTRHTDRILRRQRSRRGHGIAAMSGNDFLISFEAAECWS